jgi:hypothetical protein
MFEYRPDAQTAHLLAPARDPVFVTEPASHATQSLAAAEPVVLTYLPAVQGMHVATLDAVEYFPETHLVHSVAPTLPPLSVIEPAEQFVHKSTFDAVEYVPAAHAMHALAPAAVPLSVRDPAKHTLQ